MSLPFPCVPTYLSLIYCSSETPSKRKSKAKSQRKWGDEAPTEGDMASLDFSSEKPGDEKDNALRGSHDVQSLVDKTSLGTRDKDGMYEVKDWEFSKMKQDDEDDDIIARALSKTSLSKDSESTSGVGGGGSKLPGALGNIFARLTGSKVLSQEDLKPVLEAMKQHLMKKNVAKDIAEKVCEGVGEGLVGRKVGGWQSKLPSIYHASLRLRR